MLGRITPSFMKNDFLSNTIKRQNNLQKIQTQLTSGMKILLPSDDVANTVNYMKWESKSQDITKFNDIIMTNRDKMRVIDGNLESVTNGLQRARELVVQAATGTYTQEDRALIAMEIDQIVRQLAADANTEYKGVPIFSGTSSQSQPYRVSETFSEQMNRPMVSRVNYTGNGQSNVMDIGKNDRVTMVAPGSAVFETTTTILQGGYDVAGYIATADSTIMIDGVEISVYEGDNPETIAEKINQMDLSVKAQLETAADGNSYFRLTSLSPREPWIKDLNGGTILQDMGVIDTGISSPENYSPEAVVQKSSIFDTLINVRDNMLSNNTGALGGADLGLINQSLNNVLNYRSYTGAVTERLERTYARNETEKIYLQNSAKTAVNTNVTQSITDFKMAEFAHQTALNIGAKLMPTTLMDFLR